MRPFRHSATQAYSCNRPAHRACHALGMSDLWLAIRWLHVIAMAFFVGGQLFLAAAVVPVERRAPDRERLRAIARRFGWGTLIAIGVLLASGAAMATHYHLWDGSTLQVKLGLGALVP